MKLFDLWVLIKGKINGDVASNLKKGGKKGSREGENERKEGENHHNVTSFLKNKFRCF